jgi:hypothetical protein
MRILMAMTLAATLLGGVSVGLAQNAPTAKVPASPNSIDKGQFHSSSGAESRSAATGQPARIAGTGKYCTEASANGPLHCAYASMASCKKHNGASSLRCVANPGLGTTGSRAK